LLLLLLLLLLVNCAPVNPYTEPSGFEVTIVAGLLVMRGTEVISGALSDYRPLRGCCCCVVGLAPVLGRVELVGVENLLFSI
jgi:hypothetical protein